MDQILIRCMAVMMEVTNVLMGQILILYMVVQALRGHLLVQNALMGQILIRCMAA